MQGWTFAYEPLGLDAPEPWSYAARARELARDAGQAVDPRHHQRRVAYGHLGQLVYFLVAAPWTIPDFDLEADLEALLAVEYQLGRTDGIVLTDPRYVLEARKPG